MSIQTDWQVATAKEPALFECDYATIKVQAVCKPGSEKPEIQVRIAHEFDTDWMEAKFDEWLMDCNDTELEAMAVKVHPLLRALARELSSPDERAEIREFVMLMESHNPGLIRS